MNNHKFKIIFFLILFTNVSAQDLNKVDVFPVSPQAASLGKYGELPIDLCTGKVSYTIPIFTIKDGDFEFPIQLNYNYNGLQTGDLFGQVGAGWSINSSGYISVATRGGSDFSNFNTLGYISGNIGKDIVKPFLYGYWNHLPTAVRNENIENLYTGAASGRLDTEPDKYIVNSGNLNFSFYLDEEANPVFNSEYKNYKIEFEKFTFPNFRITDDHGNKYTFGKSEITELNTEDNTLYDAYSAFNLTSIQTSKNRTISFNYFEDTLFQANYADELRVQTLFTGMVTDCPSGRAITAFNSNNKITRNNVSEINYSNGKVTFTYLDNNFKGNRLSEVKIFDKKNNLINRFEFIYDENKKLLLEVKKYDNSNKAIPFYKLAYYGSIPDEISLKSQDLWGYYNGEYNSNLVTGNRKVNFNTTQLGALKKITYPTTGFTEIEYEQNTSKTNAFLDDSNNIEFNNYESVTASSNLLNNKQADFQRKVVYIPYKQTVRVDLNSYAGDQPGCNPEVFTSSIALFEGMATNLSFYDFAINSPDHCNSTSSFADCSPSENVNRTILVEYGPGNITLEANASETWGPSIYSTVTLNYNNSISNIFPVGGIRIKSLRDYSKIGDSKYIEKKYTYDEERVGISSGNILYKAVRYFNWGCNSNRYTTYKSNSMLPLDSYNGNPVIYSRVKENIYGGTTLKSSKIYNYSILSPDFSEFFIDDDRHKNQNGKLVTEYNLNNNAVPVSKENYFYNNFSYNIKNIIGFKSRRTYSSLSVTSSFEGHANINGINFLEEFFYAKAYQYDYKDFNLIKKETELVNSNGTISKTENYSFNKFNQLSRQTTETSAKEILETKYFYPKDTEMANKPFVNDLKTYNIGGSPLVILSFNSGKKLSEQETVYSKDATTSNLLLPKFIYANKGSAGIDVVRDKKITYDQYDNKGNILQYTPDSGVPVSIIWGYNQTQPIAKIENATYSQVKSYEANLQALADADNDYCTTSPCIGSEEALRVALNYLRAILPNAMVTTYTYDPLIGVTSITDPKGGKITFTYDSFGRLQFVKDKNGNILSENQYNYKP